MALVGALCVVLLVLTTGGLYAYFKRRRWL